MGANKRAGEKGPNNPGTGSNLPFDQKRKDEYIAEVKRVGVTQYARIKINVCPNTLCVHRKKDPAFAQAELDALTFYRNTVEEEINRRAIHGWDEPRFNKDGEQSGSVRKFSDTLLTHLSKRHIREYTEKLQVEQKTEHSGTVVAGLADLSKLDSEGRELLRKLLAKASPKVEEQEEHADGSGEPEPQS